MLENLIIGDTESVKYDPQTRVDVVLYEIIPRIKAKMGSITVWYIMKLESKTWSLAMQIPNITECKLLEINDAFRSLKVDHLRPAVIAELRKRKIIQTTLDDPMFA